MKAFTNFESRVVPLAINNIDTDQIIPARFLKTTSKQGLDRQLFNDWRYDEQGQPKPDFILNQARAKGAEILLAGDNFGCGSSREHAPWALTQFGFRAAGCEWREPGCSMCIAMNGDQLQPGEYSVSTSNRNFEGRQGKGGRTFLASPLTAAATAVTGVVTDVRSLL